MQYFNKKNKKKFYLNFYLNVKKSYYDWNWKVLRI